MLSAGAGSGTGAVSASAISTGGSSISYVINKHIELRVIVMDFKKTDKS